MAATPERKARSPYQRHNKSPYAYDGVPLHQATAGGVKRGVPVTEENVARFEERIGLRRSNRRIAA